MKNWKTSLSNLTGNKTARLIPQAKKVVYTALAVTALSFGIYNAPMASSSSKNESETTTVYYVYFNNEYIGTVSDKKVIQSVVKKKLEETKSTYAGVELSTGSQLKYIPEQVFGSRASANNEQVIKQLNEKLTIQAEAAAIMLDGEQVAFVDSKKAAEEVIKQFKLQYVSEDEMKAVEARKKNPSTELPPLQENETRILDIKLSKNVSYEKAAVTPDQLLSVENAVKFLQNGTLEQKKYQVQEGDVLGSIANDNGLTLKQMIEINPGLTEDSVLQIGQEVNITVQVPLLQVIVEKEAMLKESIAYTTETKEDGNLPKGEKKVTQTGQNGERLVTYSISEQNGIVTGKQELNATVTKQPVNEIIVKGTKVIPSRGDGSLTWPTVGGYISSQMGYRGGKLHKGIDIARPSNRTIKAADNGRAFINV